MHPGVETLSLASYLRGKFVSKLYNSGLFSISWMCTHSAVISSHCEKTPQLHQLEAGYYMLQSSPGHEELEV